MAILVDFSQIVLSACHVFENELSIYNPDTDSAKNILRHVIISQILHWKKKLEYDYGKMVICCDGKDYWRKTIFPQYKANRKKAKKESILNWNLIFEMMDQMVEDLKENFLYHVVKVDRAESDDVISTLTKYISKTDPEEKIVILSSDKDFIQLHSIPNVKQLSPIKKQWVEVEDPGYALREKVIRGDAGDGIPSILNDDCTYVDENYKTARMSKKLFDKFITEGMAGCEDKTILDHWKRNQTLIDFNFIPGEIQQNIIEEYQKPIRGSMNKIFQYLINHKCQKLLEKVDEL